ncbi:MAG: proprotein convertase P-domain-containing protein [Deltaproteobacteria bacterium]|nr:proprotein convertase P-domain-containing protein [Deltaproteobacteria bacterium]
MWRISTSSALGAALALAACGPVPTTGVDAELPRRDVGGYDQARPDAAHADAIADAGRPDRAIPTDSAPTPDAARPDLALPDQAAPDSARLDATLWYGPYQAAGLPKVLADAVDNSPRSTDTIITVPDSLGSAFVDVYVAIVHDDSHDLVVTLIPPAGSSSELFGGDSCTSGSCPYSLLIDRTGLTVTGSTLGDWVLRVTDRYSGQTGMLQTFQLTFAR